MNKLESDTLEVVSDNPSVTQIFIENLFDDKNWVILALAGFGAAYIYYTKGTADINTIVSGLLGMAIGRKTSK